MLEAVVWLHLSIPPGPVSAVMVDIARRFHGSVLMLIDQQASPFHIRTHNEVSGYLSLPGALCAALRGTGLTFSLVDWPAIRVEQESTSKDPPLSETCAGIGEPFIETPRADWK